MNLIHHTEISAELELLLQAIRVHCSQIDLKSNPGNRILARVFSLARQHGVFPLFYNYLMNQKKSIPTRSVVENNRNIYLNNVARNMQITQKLLQVLDLMATEGIKAVPFKGPVIAIRGYGDIGMRSFCDLDLLIQPKNFPRVYDLMESAGYRSIKPIIGRMKSVWRRTRRDFEFQGDIVILDFHQQVSQGPKFLQLRVEWDNLSAVELNGRKVCCLNPEDAVLLLAMHGTHHGWNILKYVSDFARMVSWEKNVIHWEKLIRKAGRMGILRMVLVGMCLGRDFCGLEIPNEINALISKHNHLDKLVIYFRGKVLEPHKSGLIPQKDFPRCLDSWRFKLRYLVYYLFNPTNLDIVAVPLPAFMYPLYFIIRPIRLLLNLAKGRKVS